MRRGFGIKGRVVIAVVLLALVIVGTFACSKYWFDGKLAEKDDEIASLENELALYADTVPVYRLAQDVKGGNACVDTDFELVDFPAKLFANTMLTNLDDIKDFQYKIDYPAGTIVLSEMYTDYSITDSMRYMDVVLDELPIGLEPGDYIDLRIAFPLGQDFIALSQKRVAEINGSTVKLIVDEKDFYYYESCKTDMATFKSTRLYGAEYVEAGIQNPATTYYPVNLEILHTMLLDPNIDTGDYSSILKSREQLENQLYESERVDKSTTVTAGRESISQMYKQAEEKYARMQQEKEKAAARAEKSESTEASSLVINKQ